MIRSMTGFGAAERQCGAWTLNVEVRCVNGRDLQVSFRLPESFYLRESELLKLVESHVRRGHVGFSLSVRPRGGEAARAVDEQAVLGWVRALKSLAEREGLEFRVDLAALLSLPGALSDAAPDENLRDGLWPDVLEVAGQALRALDEMRCAEGRNLRRQLEELCDAIESRLAAVEAARDGLVMAYRERLRERVNRLLEGSDVAVDDGALAREVAIYAERSDVSEEIERIRSHLEQFRDALRAEAGAVGRKLEFLGQELLREASTMAAKVPAGAAVAQVLELKGDVDRLREQVRNVE